MFEFIQTFTPYFQYIAPPLVGAFIGYLTNKIAIRMLFRPLKPWYLLRIRVPMTPGVIPSKRHQLAVNIGKMVGDHLLTSKEIGQALKRTAFQNHLAGLIKNRIGGVLAKDLPQLPKLIPKQYKTYFNIGVKTIAYQLKKKIRNYIKTQEFEQRISGVVNNGLSDVLDRDIDTFIGSNQRAALYNRLELYITRMFASNSMEQWLEDLLYAQISRVIKKDKSLNDILPTSVCELISSTIESNLPGIIEKLATLIQDPSIQERIVEGVKKGVDGFSQSLGPMGSMVQNFLSAETIEKTVKEYLQNNEDDIAAWLSDKEVQERVSKLVLERVQHYLAMPVASMLPHGETFNSREICKTVSVRLAALLREEGVAKTVSEMLRDNIEMYLERSGGEIRKIAIDAAGEQGVENCRRWIVREATVMVRSQKAMRIIDAIVDKMVISILQRPVGKLSDLLPVGVRDGFFNSIQKMSSAMLATEVPGLVESLNIQKIVAEKVDSLDLLRLERLLLSIMEEQFKYINLFGALLGFLIGMLNVLLIYLL